MSKRLVRIAIGGSLLLCFVAGSAPVLGIPQELLPEPIERPPEPPPSEDPPSPPPEPLPGAPSYDPNAWRDGCSIPLVGDVPLLSVALRRGLDWFLFLACDRHDLCFAKCNHPDGPYLGLPHKAQCNLDFLIEWEAACVIWAPIMEELYPGSLEEFLAACGAAGAATYAGEVILDGPFLRQQCQQGCNPDACRDLGQALPATCGGGPRPGPDWTAVMYQPDQHQVCYYWQPPPPPQDPDPDPLPLPWDPCARVFCSWNDCYCDALEFFCCGGCSSWDPWGPWDPWHPYDPWDPWDPYDPWTPFRQACVW